MEIIIFGFFLLLALIFLLISTFKEGFLYRVISGSIFLILGMFTVIEGVDIQSGLDSTTTVIDNVTSVVNETAVYTTYSDTQIWFIAFLMIVLGIFLLMTIVTKLREAE